MKKKIIVSSMIVILVIGMSTYFQAWQYLKPELIKTFIETFGVWTPIIYSIIYLIAVFIPYAGTGMTIVGGLIFTPLVGTAFAITLSSVGSVLPFLISKKFAREKIKTKIEKTKYKKYLNKTDENSFMFTLYMRLIPGIPYELQSYIIGFADISIEKFILATAIGLLPGTFTLIYLGNTIRDVSTTKLIILGSVSLFAIILPIILKKVTKAKKILKEE